jgi:nucleotidyltransferase substrate binding protein (TIGR01987 family)
MTKKNLSFEPFKKALQTLEEAIKKPPANDLERDGVIQRFKYTFEMAWKSIHAYLKALGRPTVSASPKPLIRDANEESLIKDVEAWFGFLEARNNSTHSYNVLTAQEVHKRARRFPVHAR